MNIINKIKAFLADENGAETVEWVVVAAGIAAIAVLIYSSTNGSATGLKAAIDKAMLSVTGAIAQM